MLDNGFSYNREGTEKGGEFVGFNTVVLEVRRTWDAGYSSGEQYQNYCFSLGLPLGFYGNSIP